MRYIHEIYTVSLGQPWDNERLLSVYEPSVERLPLSDPERTRLRDFVRFQLVGERSRRSVVDFPSLDGFQSRAAAFEAGAEQALDALAERIAPAADAAGILFDAVVTTTTTGNLMPGLSYRITHRLGARVRPDALMLDLANVGCTGGVKALKLARSLGDGVDNVLIVAVELPTTLADLTGTTRDVWQGNCTFGDGAAALWLSADPARGPAALALETIHARQRSDAGLGLIRWGYRRYYGFAVADEPAFDRAVRGFVTEALSAIGMPWKGERAWAIHPAGIALLVRLARQLGIPPAAVEPSVRHYREHSNMSSVSVLHVLKDVASACPPGSAVNLLTMGAGFDVLYGRLARVR